jgi:hypothetical protein
MSGETAASIANMPLRNIVAFGVVAVFVFATILVIIVVTFRLMKNQG